MGWIEAAKAGEYGRGFSVVAAEVRTLAEQSKEAARQIRETIRQTDAGQEAVEATFSVIVKLAQVLQNATDRARTISGSAVQQAAGIKQIAEAMSNLTQGGHDTAAAAQQLRAATVELETVGLRLSKLMQS